jgi:hypothetical protein
MAQMPIQEHYAAVPSTKELGWCLLYLLQHQLLSTKQ